MSFNYDYNMKDLMRTFAKVLESDYDQNNTSGNNLVDEIIKSSQRRSIADNDFFEWIDFNKFDNLQYITCGGIGNIHSAIWKDGPARSVSLCDRLFNREGERVVAIKFFKTNKEFLDEFVNIFKMIEACTRASGNEKNQFGIVMQYINAGNLENYLEDNWRTITWKEKLGILKDIAHGLSNLHNAELIHGDINTRNVFVSKDIRSTGYIGDFGYCGVDEPNARTQRRVIPFIAPELLLGKTYTKKADIYSFGLIMYQVATNTRPKRYRGNNRNFERDILNGFRPGFDKELMPHGYASLMRNCWNSDRKNRPKAENLYKKFCEWEDTFYEPDSPFRMFRFQKVEPSYNIASFV
ncbi:11848_t:CDS:2 [Funneliformis geosporum]|uniref:14713_t:CDS:1 n=1 Tax=Funneliformis geosporum TaxID=1117311 RepID=A0A9W4SGN6_9GLOM|nr:14713_t:CDS:2 [Funneliformis geosporum]CAI2170015.1 11848_t:CDS:2 [Funneliformis geosporum]